MKVKFECEADYRPSLLEQNIEQNLKNLGIVLAPPCPIDLTESFFNEPFIRREASGANASAKLSYERWFQEDVTEEFFDEAGAWLTVPLEIFGARFNDPSKYREVIQFGKVYESWPTASGITLFYSPDNTLKDVDISVGRPKYLVGLLRHLGLKLTTRSEDKIHIFELLQAKKPEEAMAALIDYHFKEK